MNVKVALVLIMKLNFCKLKMENIEAVQVKSEIVLSQTGISVHSGFHVDQHGLVISRSMDQLTTTYSTGLKSQNVFGGNKIRWDQMNLVISRNIMRLDPGWIWCNQLVHGSCDHRPPRGLVNTDIYLQRLKNSRSPW